MRGQKIFNEIMKDNGVETSLRRGRNNSLIYRRNKCLVARYFYYASVKNRCYEDTLHQLVTEFYLSASTIANVIRDNAEQLQLLKQKPPSIYNFQTKWPHIKW